MPKHRLRWRAACVGSSYSSLSFHSPSVDTLALSLPSPWPDPPPDLPTRHARFYPIHAIPFLGLCLLRTFHLCNIRRPFSPAQLNPLLCFLCFGSPCKARRPRQVTSSHQHQCALSAISSLMPILHCVRGPCPSTHRRLSSIASAVPTRTKLSARLTACQSTHCSFIPHRTKVDVESTLHNHGELRPIAQMYSEFNLRTPLSRIANYIVLFQLTHTIALF